MRVGVSYISKRYSKSDDNTEIMYWDGNNLYGWAMIKDLPYSSFKFLNDKEINDFNLYSINENSPIGYILEVNLEYRKELHDGHSDYPLTYVVHYKNLKYYLSLEMKLVKIHRILSFKQSDWLRKYVDFNTKEKTRK